jgi:hypothetical protein
MHSILLQGLSMVHDLQVSNEQKLKEVEEEWWKSADYPRKKKKKIRKRLVLEYSIFSYAIDMFKF